jgi:hypothetical protein
MWYKLVINLESRFITDILPSDATRPLANLYIWYRLAQNFSFNFYGVDNINIQNSNASKCTKSVILEVIYKPCSSVFI